MNEETLPIKKIDVLRNILKEIFFHQQSIIDKFISDEQIQNGWQNVSAYIQVGTSLHEPKYKLLEEKVNNNVLNKQLQIEIENCFKKIIFQIYTEKQRDTKFVDRRKSQALPDASKTTSSDNIFEDEKEEVEQNASGNRGKVSESQPTDSNDNRKHQISSIGESTEDDLFTNEYETTAKKLERHPTTKKITSEHGDIEVAEPPSDSDEITVAERTEETSTAVETTEIPSQPYLLKNGKVGQKYSEIIDFSKICSTMEIKDLTIEGLEATGLELDIGKKEIKGIPKQCGNASENFEFGLVLRYETNDGHKGKRTLSIKIFPDPRTLWKEIEPSKDLGDPKDHSDRYYGEIGIDRNGKKRYIIAASKRGRAHAHKGTFRDDHMKIKYMEDLGWSIISVADGAGSAELSRVGSKIACETAVNFVKDAITKKCDELKIKIEAVNSKEKNNEDNELKILLYDILAKAGFQANQAIKKEKKLRQTSIGKFHTTLVLGIHKSFGFGNFFAGFWIGDGALSIYDKEGKKLKLLGVPDVGEYSGQTKFVTEEKNFSEKSKPFERVYYSIWDDFTAFMAMSDGITDPKFPTESQLGEFNYWNQLWQDLENDVIQSVDEPDKSLLNWLDFWADGEHDDRTIAILF